MSIVGLLVALAVKAPTQATPIASRSIFLLPTLSLSRPAGMVRSAWQRLGIEAMMPICWLVSMNSSRSTGNRAVCMFWKLWVMVCVSVITMRL